MNGCDSAQFEEHTTMKIHAEHEISAVNGNGTNMNALNTPETHNKCKHQLMAFFVCTFWCHFSPAVSTAVFFIFEADFDIAFA